jgi:hypothetical protein
MDMEVAGVQVLLFHNQVVLEFQVAVALITTQQLAQLHLGQVVQV